MRVGIVGSRNAGNPDIEKFLPKKIGEIVSGGAKGVDTLAREYALKRGMKLTEFLPEYEKFARGAPVVRNRQIVEYADIVIAFRDGKSRGAKSVITYCEKIGKKHIVIKI